MAEDYNQLGFRFTGLRTVAFAIIEKSFKKTGETGLKTGLGFGVDIDDHTITCNARFEFERKKDQPFLILEVQGHFEIEQKDFNHKIDQGSERFLITRNLATHFAVLTVGAARGILHAKTENTVYNEFLLPTIDIRQMIEEDVLVS